MYFINIVIIKQSSRRNTFFFFLLRNTHIGSYFILLSILHKVHEISETFNRNLVICLFFFFLKKKTFLKFKYGWFAMLCLFPVYSKEGWSCRNQAPWLQTIWQSYKSKHHATHTHARTHTHTQTPEIDTNGTGRKPRNKPMLLSLINLQQRRQRYNGEKTFSLISAGKTGQLHTKEWNQNIL